MRNQLSDDQDNQAAMEETTCPRHPKEATNLRCSRCSQPVCVKCMVYTPVGIRCPDCARERKSSVYAPSATHIARALGAGAVVAVVAGVVWGLFPLYGFWFALLLGFVGGEIVSTAANRKRGPELQIIAGGMVIAAFAIAYFVSGWRGTGFELRIIFEAVVAVLAFVLAVIRQR